MFCSKIIHPCISYDYGLVSESTPTNAQRFIFVTEKYHKKLQRYNPQQDKK